ncbi:MAG TPA: ComEC family competence protein, partial [Flavobacterium sp.]|nr:ComEC family competence protein [Flavobacterium sp.]
MKVLDFPLVKITFAFIFGVVASYYMHFSISLVALLLALFSVLFCLSYYSSLKNSKKYILFGFSVYSLSFILGILTLLSHTESLQKDNYTQCKSAFENPQSIVLLLREKLKSNDYSDRYIAHVKSISGKNYSGKIIINVQKD